MLFITFKIMKYFSPSPSDPTKQGINFSFIKVFLTDYVLCRSRLLRLKTGGQTYKQRALPKSYKTEIKIHDFLANPGLS